MGFLRKITAAVIAGVLLCLAGAGTLSEPVLMPQEHVLQQAGKPFRKQSITKKKRVKCLILCCGGSGTPPLST